MAWHFDYHPSAYSLRKKKPFWWSTERKRMMGHQYLWLAGGYELEIDIFRSG